MTLDELMVEWDAACEGGMWAYPQAIRMHNIHYTQYCGGGIAYHYVKWVCCVSYFTGSRSGMIWFSVPNNYRDKAFAR